jgi:sodium/hydrogen exchanger-like protein 6/7
MGFRINVPEPLPSDNPQPQEEEFYSSWSLFLVCSLLILSLLTSYFLKIKKIKTVHETLVSIVAGMAVGLVVRIAPGTMIEHMLVSYCNSATAWWI